MNLVGNAITAVVTLLAVALGGWLSVRNQDRLWRRDHERQWRDIRLSAYKDFLSAYREYVAFAQEPTAKISAVPHPRRHGEMMPFFDKKGRPYKEKLEATTMSVSLVSERPETRDALFELIRRARIIAAARAMYSPGDIPDQAFQELFEAHNAFVFAARRELGLSDRPGSA